MRPRNRVCTAALAGLAVLLAEHPSQAEPQVHRPVTAQAVMAQVQQKGPSAALALLFESPQWEPILDGVAGGGEGWLRVAEALRPVSDAASAEDLDNAISEALGPNALGVLRLVRNKVMPAEDACSRYGFMTQTRAATKVKMQRFVARRRQAVVAVSDPDVAKPKAECLAALDDAEHRIDNELGGP